MLKSRDKWTDDQKERAELLFEMYQKFKEAYGLVNSLRSIFKNKKQTKDSAKERLHEWYGKVTDCTLREIKSVRDTIKAYEDDILNTSFLEKLDCLAISYVTNKDNNCYFRQD